jgi:hypothetical protein
LSIHRTQHHERQLGVERPVLVRHPCAGQLPLADTGHHVDGPDGALQGQLAFVPGRGFGFHDFVHLRLLAPAA